MKKHQTTDHMNTDASNARGAKAKGSSHGTSPRFGNDDEISSSAKKANRGGQPHYSH